MRLPRPRVPVAVKVAVAERQLRERGTVPMYCGYSDEMRKRLRRPGPSPTSQLRSLLATLFGNEPCHLDHDPPLWQRKRTVSGKYRPDANDPNFLVWRTAEEHRIKTYVKGDGAQLSDASKRRKEIKRKRAKPKRRWPSRPLRMR